MDHIFSMGLNGGTILLILFLLGMVYKPHITLAALLVVLSLIGAIVLIFHMY
jgi:membrane-anchored protein YejM (alkaline phosphatase superfamily)